MAVAGPPASGKSTLAADLVAGLGAKAALVPMDGFHLDNRVLQARGLLGCKGAPETFDAFGFVRMVQRLAQEDEVMIPVFDRAQDVAIAGAQVVGPDAEIAIIEGNYLLLDRQPWAALREIWDMSVFLDVPMPELERRLIRRWLYHDHSPAEALARARSSDLPNAQLVLTHSGPADIRI